MKLITRKKILVAVCCALIVAVLLVHDILATVHLAQLFSLSKNYTQLIDSSFSQNQSEGVFDTKQLLSNLQDPLHSQLNQFKYHFEKSLVIQHTIGQEKKDEFEKLFLVFEDFLLFLSHLQTGKQRWIVLFQNSNELRATGGFMGSYLVVDIEEGKITQLTTEDIYDADGQFTGYVTAPAGVEQYLSEAKGLRLPDSNWNPDYPQSAQQILQFFALGNKQNVSGVVSVNLEFAKQLIETLGPLTIADYNTIVTPNNIDEVLRSRRADFFPGSTQKKHFLSLLLTQVKLHIMQADLETKKELLAMVVKNLQDHTLQMYSPVPEIDLLFAQYALRQEIEVQENADYLYLVESNVGINKANKHIDRRVSVNKTKENKTITVIFDNKNIPPVTSRLSQEIVVQTEEKPESDHLAYINYQRVIVPVDWKLENVLFDSQPITQIDSQTITDTSGNELTEIGFLLTVPEQQTKQLELLFTDQTPAEKQLYIQKQSGITTIPYTLESNNTKTNFELVTDMLVNYP